MYVYINPQKQAPNEPKITWEMAQKEIAEATGYAVQKDAVLTKGSINFCFLFLFACHILTKKKTAQFKDQQIIQEQILELLPMISDVNAISDELNKYRHFEVVMIPAIAYDPQAKSHEEQK